ncbi:PTS sugar transporter subunit IIC, partial [Eggerthella sinensis]|uniref:PTS sugar transporter subunit IIC n=1 Tax=Eggerthella sinensis TaxID=242230 RepID=UPI0022E65481
MTASSIEAFLKRKDIEITFQRYAIDALSAMAQGLFASLLIGTILTTIGDLSHLAAFNQIGTFAKSVAGPAMAIAIGYALRTPPLVLFSLAAVGYAANDVGGAGGPLAVLVIAIVASELGKAVSKETKVDIIVTPAVTILGGCGLALVAAPWIGALASSVGGFIMWATELQPFFMGIIVSVVIGIALTLPSRRA